MSKFNKLSRAEMKSVLGGTKGDGTPPAPVGNLSTNSLPGGGGDGGSGYRCCWNDAPTNCSDCKQEAQSNWTCVSGASLSSW